jgi:hypothetical protein
MIIKLFKLFYQGKKKRRDESYQVKDLLLARSLSLFAIGLPLPLSSQGPYP